MKECLEFCLQKESQLVKEIIIKMFELAEVGETTESLKNYKQEDVEYCMDLLFNKFRALYTTLSGIHLSLEHFEELYEQYKNYPEMYSKWYEKED